MTFLFFGLEFLVVSVVLVTLYQQRARIGMYGVVVALASIQMLQGLLASSFYWPVADGMLVSPGSSVLFASNLAILLVAYSFGGTRDARIVLYSVVCSNICIAVFGLLLSAQIAAEPPSNFLGVPAEVFSQGVLSSIVGILVLYLDQLLAILAFAFLDVDTFKSVNDSLGHAGGDQILKDLAEVMRASIRDDDLAFRIGGDEFVLLLPHTKLSGAVVVAERLNRATIVHEKLDDPVTITIGIAVFPQDGRTQDELFEAADKRMYRGKEAGRNQIICE